MKKILTSILFTFLIFAFTTTANAATLVVNADNTDPNCDEEGDDFYCTIQAAINAVDTEGTIEVAAGTYDEQLLINGKNILLIADGKAIIHPTSRTPINSKYHVIQIYNSVTTIEGFEINADYKLEYGTSSTIGNDAIYAKGGFPGYGSVNVTIIDNNIHDYGKNGITVNGELATAVIEDNIVTGRGPLFSGDYCQNGIQLGWSATGTITGNTVTDHHYRVRDADDKYQYGTQETDWAATGILLYDVNPELAKSSGLKSQNTFEDNEFDVLMTPAAYVSGGQYQYKPSQ